MKISAAWVALLSGTSVLVTASPTSQGSVPKPSTSPVNSANSKNPNQTGGTPPTTTKQTESARRSSSATQSARSTSTTLNVEYSAYDWKKVGCDDPTAKDEKMDPKERWEKSGAVHAWGQAYSHWLKQDSGRKFSQSITDFYGGPPNAFCGEHLGDETNCQTVPDCSEKAAHGFNSSGGYMVTRSMFSLNQAYTNMWNAYNEGKDQTNLVEMTNTFGPTTNHVERDKIIATAVLMGFGIGTAGLWNKVFKAHPVFVNNPNALGSIKDAVNAAVVQSIAILKVTSKAGSAVAKWEKANDVMDTLHTAWVETISTTAENMFNGSANSIGDLYNHIKDGQFLELNDAPGTKGDDIKEAKTAYASFIIPEIWAMSDAGPVVIDTGKSCTNDKNEVTAKWNRTWLPYSKKLMDYWACVDGKTYFLLGAQGKEAEGCNDDCKTTQFRPVRGIEKLADFGIDFKDIITGSVNSYKKNGNKNGYTVDTLDQETIDEMYDSKYTTPGVFTIPVCGEYEAGGNWHDHSNSPLKSFNPKYYPCN